MEPKSYTKYRWFFTSDDKLVIGGKSAEQNEQIMKNVEKDSYILHTSSPGSPFCIIKNPSKKELEEVAVFDACFSQEWKRAKKYTEVHIFNGSQILKSKNMKLGTFGVIGDIKKIKVELKLALDIQKGRLRAVPLNSAKNKIIILKPGKIPKEKSVEIIKKTLKEKYNLLINKDEILSAIPSGGFKIEI